MYYKRHIGIQTSKEKGFNFELYKFSYLLLTILYYIVLSTYFKEHGMYICMYIAITGSREKKDISNLI